MSRGIPNDAGKQVNEKAKGRRKAMGSLRARLAGALIGALLLIGLAAPAAQAEYRLINVIQPVGSSEYYYYKGSFMPRGMAVDPETHDLFLGGMAFEGQLHKFDASEVETVFGRETTFWGYIGVVLDPQTQTVYALNTETQRVERYAYSTKKLAPAYFQVEGNGQLAIGPEGNFFVPSSEFGFKALIMGKGVVNEYSHNGSFIQTIECNKCIASEEEVESLMGPTSVALDSAGNLYVADTENNRVIKFENSGGEFKNPTVFVHAEHPTHLALDSHTGDLFVGEGEWSFSEFGSPSHFHVSGYHPDGSKWMELPAGFSENQESPFYNSYATYGGGDAIAVDSKTGELYIADMIYNTEPPPGQNASYERIYVYGELPPPSAETAAATVEASRHVTLNAKVNPHGSTVEQCRFLWGETTAYGNEAPCVPDPGFGVEAVSTSAEISGLEPTKTYHYKVVVSNEVGEAEGKDVAFTTLIDTPGVNTGQVSGLSHLGATLEGTVNPGGNPVTECRFEYGTDTSYGAQAPCSSPPGSGSGPVPESAAISGLTPQTTYHYRLLATNAGGASEGEDHTFTTLPHPPAASTGAASQIVADGAKITGHVNPEGALTSFYFEYGQSASYGHTTPPVTTPAAMPKPAFAFLSGLTPSTTYHYRLIATNPGGTTPGADQTFTTAPRPIGQTSIPATGKISSKRATVTLTCRGEALAECQGTMTLRSRIKRGIRFILVKIGAAPFDIFGGQSASVSVSLNGNGHKILKQSAGHKMIRAVSNAAETNRELRLKLSGRRHGHRGRGRHGRR
jgi:NHL repeat